MNTRQPPPFRPTTRSGRAPWRRFWGSAAVTCLLVGCSSTPPVRPPGKELARPAPVEGAVRPAQDGAPANPPADLLAVPDAVPRIEPIRPGGPNKPYEALGTRYDPLTGDVPFTQRGKASWYGTKFHGRRTASGEAYSMYGMTAAHRTLPIPSYIRVRGITTGQEVVVRVNDRGPFHSDRILDLSYTAALKLGLLGRGSGEVEIERLTFEQISRGSWGSPDATVASAVQATLPPEDPILALASQLDVSPRPPAVPDAVPPAEPVVQQARAFTPDSKGFWVQLAAFSGRRGVEAFQQRVAQEMSQFAPLLAVYQDGSLWRLQVGPYPGRQDAQGVARQVRDALHLVPMVVERR